jgi:hypothetical protein
MGRSALSTLNFTGSTSFLTQVESPLPISRKANFSMVKSTSDGGSVKRLAKKFRKTFP